MNKTGTSSLATALSILGFKCMHWARKIKVVARENNAAGRRPLYPLDEEYAAFCDSPINYMFRELDAAYPGSKFILTVRDLRPWVVSRIAQFGGTPDEHRRKLAGHHNAVMEHFEKRKHDLLVYDLCGGAGWAPLCDFLGVPVPRRRFPWQNKTSSSRKGRAIVRVKGLDPRFFSS